MIAMLLLAALQAAPDPSPRLLNGGAVLTNDDYPKESLQRKESGIVSFVAHVSAAGKVTGCDVTETSGFLALDTVTCRLVRLRARFVPATDAGGAPIASDYVSVMTWGVGGRWPKTAMDITLQTPSLPADYKAPTRARLIFDGTGHVATCKVTMTSGSDTIDRSVCAYVTRQITIKPPKSQSHDIPAAAVRSVTATLSVGPGTPAK